VQTKIRDSQTDYTAYHNGIAAGILLGNIDNMPYNQKDNYRQGVKL
jgi:hypothetical protein